MWNQSKRRNPKSRNRYRPPRVAEPASSTTESKSSHTDEDDYHEETVEDVHVSNQDSNENFAPDESDLSSPSDLPTDVSFNSKDVQVPHSSSSEHIETKRVDLPLKMSETIIDEPPTHEQTANLIFNVQDDSYNMQGSVDSVKLNVSSSAEEFNSEVSENSEASSMSKAPRDPPNIVNEMEFSSELLKQENELDLLTQKDVETSLIETKNLVDPISNSVKESQTNLVAESQQLNISAADENEKSLSQESAIEKSTSEVSNFSLKNEETCVKDEECLQSKLDSKISNNLQNQTDTNINDHEVQEDLNDQFSPLKPTLLIQTTSESDVIEIKNTVKEMISSLEICTAKNSEGQITEKASSCVDPEHKDLDSSKTEPKRMMLEGPESEKVVPNKRFKTGYFTETSGANVDQSVDSGALLEEETDESEIPDLVPVLESEPSFTPYLEIGRVFDFLDWESVSVDIDAKLLAASIEDMDRVVITLGENVTSSTQNLFNNGPVLKHSNNSESSSDTQSSDDTSSDASNEVNSDVTMQANEESGSDENGQKQASNRRIIPVENASDYDRNAQFSSSTGFSSDTTDDSRGENLEYEIDISRFDEDPFHGVIATVRPRYVSNQQRLNTTIFLDVMTAIFSYCFYIFLASFVLFVTWMRNKLRF